MSYLVLRNKIYHIYYYDPVNQKVRSFSTKTSDKTSANRILKNFEAKRLLNLLPDNLVKKHQLIKFSDAMKLFISNKTNLKTKLIYEQAAKQLLNFIGDKYVIQYSSMDYLKLIDSLRSKKLSQNTIANYTRHLSSIFNWFIENEFVNKNIIQRTKIQKKEVEPIPHEHLIKIFRDLVNRNMMKQYNFVKLLYLTGFRISELINAHGEDFNIKDEIIFVRNSKGKRIDKIPILNEIKIHLLEFPCKEGKIFNYKSIYSVRSFWKNLNKRLGYNYTMHQLRKTRGTELANIGVNPYFLQKFMRHTDIKTTLSYYVKIDLEKMKEEIDNKICNRFAIDFRQG